MSSSFTSDVLKSYPASGISLWETEEETPQHPSCGDPTGLRLPKTTAIAGYVYWSQGVEGPRTERQTWLDSRIVLEQSIHCLSKQALRESTPAWEEWDELKARPFEHRHSCFGAQ